jgi:hypothetical protein
MFERRETMVTKLGQAAGEGSPGSKFERNTNERRPSVSKNLDVFSIQQRLLLASKNLI